MSKSETQNKNRNAKSEIRNKMKDKKDFSNKNKKEYNLEERTFEFAKRVRAFC